MIDLAKLTIFLATALGLVPAAKWFDGAMHLAPAPGEIRPGIPGTGFS
jgi:hypothetical protein